jgi:hypothetical protein
VETGGGQSEEIRVFHNDDAGYEAWVERYGGYVLTERPSGGYMLHESECSHLGRGRDMTLVLTKRSRHWAKARRPLSEWAQAHGDRPQLCQSCL